jgi:hypothetical protein
MYTDGERRSSNNAIVEPTVGSLWTVASTSSSRHSIVGTTLSGTMPSSGENVLPRDFVFSPPPYDSLVPAADDYDKSPPPSYQELVIDVSGCYVGPSALCHLPSGATSASGQTSVHDQASIGLRPHDQPEPVSSVQLPTSQTSCETRQFDVEVGANGGIENHALDVTSEIEADPRTVCRPTSFDRTDNTT